LPKKGDGNAGRSVRDLLRAQPDHGRVNLGALDPAATHGVTHRHVAGAAARDGERIMELQNRLYAEGKRSVLIVLQGTDTSGKDGTVRHALHGLNPQGVRVASFKAPTPTELRHDFLWRIRRQLPGPGEVAIFNRSHYEDVLIARVEQLAQPAVIEKRYGLINQFEAGLAKRGTTVVKLCLHISYEEQRERLLKRLSDPRKNWKFNPDDIPERQDWDTYQAAYDVAIGRCSPASAPWYIVPADHKWYRNWAVSRVLIETVEEMNPTYPRPKLDVQALTKRLQEAA
jgi:PPK2 family polyphosphate:nucleotide phosphotransferase